MLIGYDDRPTPTMVAGTTTATMSLSCNRPSHGTVATSCLPAYLTRHPPLCPTSHSTSPMLYSTRLLSLHDQENTEFHDAILRASPVMQRYHRSPFDGQGTLQSVVRIGMSARCLLLVCSHPLARAHPPSRSASHLHTLRNGVGSSVHHGKPGRRGWACAAQRRQQQRGVGFRKMARKGLIPSADCLSIPPHVIPPPRRLSTRCSQQAPASR